MADFNTLQSKKKPLLQLHYHSHLYLYLYSPRRAQIHTTPLNYCLVYVGLQFSVLLLCN